MTVHNRARSYRTSAAISRDLRQIGLDPPPSTSAIRGVQTILRRGAQAGATWTIKAATKITLAIAEKHGEEFRLHEPRVKTMHHLHTVLIEKVNLGRGRG